MDRLDLIAAALADGLTREAREAWLRAGAPLEQLLSDRAGHDRTLARDCLQQSAHLGQQVVCWRDPAYPPLLAAIADPPLALWVRGDPDVLARPAVAVVGSRAATPYALEIAERLGHDLATAGLVVVSGLARGVDSAAHRGALAAGGITVAILGSGADIIYPPEHAGLAEAVGAAGAVATEHPPGTPPRAGHFPRRNRLISGLSVAVVVVEAHEKSGSLITAGFALDQGREVMAVPGNVLTGRSRGSHALLRDGAKIVESADDILEELGVSGQAAVSGIRPNPRTPDPILACLPAGEAVGLDDLADRTGVSAARLLPRLLELELGGLIRRADGGRFVRSPRTC